MDIYLVRHGESEANAGLTMDLDSHLTALGKKQAAATAERLATAGITQAFISPFMRTLETAQPICERSQIQASLDPLICEYFSARHPEFLTFRGLAPQEITKRFPYIAANPSSLCDTEWWPRKHENPDDIYARAVTVRDRLLQRYGAGDVRLLYVSHADTVGRLIEAFLRVPPNEPPPWNDNCSINLLRVTDDRTAAEVVLRNDTSHLSQLYADAP